MQAHREIKKNKRVIAHILSRPDRMSVDSIRTALVLSRKICKLKGVSSAPK